MGLYYTLPVVILNKMAVKLDFLSCRRADVISRQRQRSRINSGGSSLILTAGLSRATGDGGGSGGGGGGGGVGDSLQGFVNLIIIKF